uniref:CCHC-type domain-containing protein n=1 Tax=Davidia involucrata TaxID=16924 RepID=A0A5B7C190_DAVIN
MANRPDPDIDDDFREIYKEYTGPPGSNATNVQDKAKTNKRSQASSDEEEEARDPNAVPTDFTSREAKVWEAKSKATERNWKKRKEEEMICKICGESGHFTQGCPSTLGANRKSQDFFERVPAREKHVKALFTEKVIHKIEKDIGCKIKVEERFIIVSGKDRLILAKGVDAVHKIKEEGDKKGSSSSHMTRSRSPERRSPVGSRLGRSDSQRSLPSPQNASQFQQRFGRQDKVVEDRVHEDLQKLSRGSPQAYGNDGARGRSSHSKSPARPPYTGNSYNSYDGHSQRVGAYRTDGWDSERRGSDMQSGRKFEYTAFPQTLEELELEYKREAMDLGEIRDKEEDEENYKHREAVREMRENYMKKLAILRGMHAKQWEEFLQLDAQRRQQRARQKMSTSGFGGYKQPSYPEYDSSAGNPHYAGANLPMDSRGRYPNPMENYPSSRPHDTYGDFQRQRREDYGKAYNRY